MIPRFLNVQGMIGLAAAVLLLGLFLAKAVDARHWRKQSARYEQLYVGEQAARAGTIANYRAAAETARRDDLAHAARVAAAQRSISERTNDDLEARLADARARAHRLQLASRTPTTTGGGGRAAPVPAARSTTGPTGGAAEKDRLPLADALIATEQAIQLDELIKWVRAQAGIERPEARSGPSPWP